MVEDIKVSATLRRCTEMCSPEAMSLRTCPRTNAGGVRAAPAANTRRRNSWVPREVPEWVGPFLVAILSLACYLNSLDGDFVHDDLVAVTTNPDVLGRTPITDLLWNDYWGKPMSDPGSHKSYRPLTVLTFRTNRALFGLSAMAFHMTNVALHTAVVLLLMQFCKEVLSWRREACFTAALLFASHPIHTEAVSSIVGRADILCCVLYLSALIACSRESFVWQGVSLICASSALLAKEHGITVLGVCLIYHFMDFTEKRQTGRRTIEWLRSDLIAMLDVSDSVMYVSRVRLENGRKRNVENKNGQDKGSARNFVFSVDASSVCAACLDRKIVATITTMLMLIYIRGCMLHGSLPQFSEQDNPAAFSTSWTTRFLTYSYLPAFNAWLLLEPITLSYDWQMGSIPLIETPWDERNLATVSFFFTLGALLVQASRGVQVKEKKRLVLSLSLMILPFLPASNIIVTVGFVVAERVLYIPSLGFCILVSHGLQRLVQRGPILAWVCRAFAVVLILLFVLKTVSRNSDWSSREALFRSGLQSVPNNAKVHYNYANYRKDAGDEVDAMKHYRIALSLWPRHASSHNNLGTLLGNPDEAEKHFIEALNINSCHAKAHYNLATIYSKRGETGLAEKLLLRAINLDPEFVSAVSSLGSLYADSDKRKEAEIYHLWALSLDPENADSLNNYGTFLEMSGRTFEAIRQYERAINAQPNHTVAILNAARSMRSMKHSRRSEELYKRALEIQEDPLILDNLGMLYISSGRYGEAREIYEHMIVRYPQQNESKLHFSQLLIQERSYQKAEVILLSLCVEGAPDSITRDTHHLLASLYSLTNRTTEALDSILKALTLCPPDDVACGVFYEEHGDIMRDVNDFESAEESYRLAISLDPNLHRAHMNLAVIYHIKGNYSMAEAHYQEAYKLDSTPEILLENMRKLQRSLFNLSKGRCWRTDASCRLE